MYGVDLYRRVRLACHREGLSGREAARRFGIDRKTVTKILAHSVPPGYRRRRPPKRPKLDPFTDIIERILVEEFTVSSAIRRSGSSNVFATSMASRADRPSSRITFANGAVASGRCLCRWRILQAMLRRTLARRMRSSPG